MREKLRLKVFEDRGLRKIYGPRRDEVTEERRIPRNKELHAVYCSPNINRVIKSKRMRRERHVPYMGDRIGEHRILVGRSEGKRPLGRPRYGRENNIKMDIPEVK